ncbi:ABC transporter permease [Duganella qianjiadongensis]|uniref:ABC transporter permease n=1 Tax=Duganella qianjiadongensis TaxID=2692176 RepID=A0ABW9VSJ6_9BURK|nr:ABC transporter permease [Duganella qianjiadongensis]MYM42053.1 ABC transporter permease [Duganella qianjiadongensis]
MSASFTIARYTILEAVRNRWLWLLLGLLLACIALSGLLDAMALTESRQIRLALLSSLLRLASVFLLTSFVVSSMAREAADKGQQMLLALAHPRATYLAGKLLGYAALALLPALLSGLLAGCYAPPLQAGLWALSLLGECWIMLAFAVLCMVSMQQLPAALAACSGFYLLARSIGTLQLLAHGSRPDGSSSTAASRVFDLLGTVLPHLDRYGSSDWLVYQSGSLQDLAGMLAQTALFVTLLVLAALYDLYRKAV